VTIFDNQAGLATQAVSGITKVVEFLRKNGLAPSETTGKVTVASTLEEAVADCDYVQESVFESYDVKRKAFRQITIIASSTSSLSITKIQNSATNPKLCLSVHPLNPVYIIPAVEIAGGRMTSVKTVERVCEFMVRMGKVPVRLNEVRGHVADRLQAAVWREALDLLDRGVASARDIDRVVSYGLGPRWAIMGPFLRAHLAGGEGGLEYYLKHIEPSHSVIWKGMRNWKKAPSRAKKKALSSVDTLTEGKSYSELVAWRDDLLARLIGLKEGNRGRRR